MRRHIATEAVQAVMWSVFAALFGFGVWEPDRLSSALMAGFLAVASLSLHFARLTEESQRNVIDLLKRQWTS